MDVQRKKIGIVDTTLRDAHQCLWATRMKTAHMLPVAEAMDKAGFAQIDRSRRFNSTSASAT